MKPFSLLFSNEAKQRIRHLHPKIKTAIRDALDELKENPWLGKTLQRELTGLQALRVQNHRVIYQIDEEKSQIYVLTLGIRKTIYQSLSSKK